MKAENSLRAILSWPNTQMKKDNIRDYAVDAFRFYASLQCKPDKAAARFALQRKTLKRGLKSADLRASEAALQDVYAVIDTIHMLNTLSNGKEILKTLETVYFSNPNADMRRGEIENRVMYVTLITHISSATAYRHLALCRRLFAEARGLRLAA